MNSTINTSMMSGDISEPSSPESTFDENDLLNATVHDDVTAQLAAAGRYQSFSIFDQLKSSNLYFKFLCFSRQP